MTERRITLVIPGRAVSRVIDPAGGPGYFQSLYVHPRHRRRGHCLEIMKFAISYTREFLEMDIKKRTAEAAQHNAARLGYVKVGQSERWDNCELWRYKGSRHSGLPESSLRVLRKVTCRRRDGVTEVLYLR